MSTKQQTNGSSNTGFNFDPTSMQAYLKNIGTVMPFLQSNVSNPFGSDTFKQESVMGQDQAAKVGQRGVSNVSQNAAAMGYNTSGGMFNSMLQRAGQNTSALQGQAFRGAVGNANARQMSSAGMLSSFQPLMTGSNSTSQQTQQTSGLGTWLPQLAGALGGAAMSAFTGGIGGGASGGSSSPTSAGMGIGSMGSGANMFGSGIGSMFGGIPQSNGAYSYGAAGRG